MFRKANVYILINHEGIAGLAVAYGLNLNILQASVVRKLCNMENSIISVERILQYTSIISEAPLVESNRPNDLWPQHGEVDIHDLQVTDSGHLQFTNLSS